MTKYLILAFALSLLILSLPPTVVAQAPRSKPAAQWKFQGANSMDLDFSGQYTFQDCNVHVRRDGSGVELVSFEMGKYVVAGHEWDLWGEYCATPAESLPAPVIALIIFDHYHVG